MTHVSRIELENFGPFRGEHVVDLKAGVYALTARHVDDEDRSNWLGKTTFLRAIPFALLGTLPPAAKVQSEWITRGESEGAVRLLLSDGLSIVRSLTCGGSTQLTATASDGTPARQDRAQEIINAVVGLDERGFFTRSFFDQKSMSDLIGAKASELHKTARAWFDLGRLEAGEILLKKKLAAKTSERDAATSLLRTREQQIADALGDVSADDVGQLLEDARAAATAAHVVAVDLGEKLDEDSDWLVRAEHASEYDRIAAEAKDLKKQIADLNPDQLVIDSSVLKEAAEIADAALALATDETLKRDKLSRGKFDGTCPITCRECPVAESVRDEAAENKSLLENACAKERAARDASRAERAKLAVVERGLAQAKRAHRDYVAMKKRATNLLPDKEFVREAGPPPDRDDLKASVQQAWEDHSRAVAEVARLERCDLLVSELTVEVRDLRAKAEAAEAEATTLREAAHVFGRRGAQRRVAVGGLSKIEAAANAGLADAGIGLSLNVSWEREAEKGLADNCDFCGRAFPRSQTEKTCACGALRGPKIIDSLEVVPSYISGAANDLVGIHFQLAASAWCRRRSASTWSVACLDEPFAYVDPANKRAMTSHLVQTLGTRYGFSQVFITAHDRTVLEALPLRLEIEADDNRSWIK